MNTKEILQGIKNWVTIKLGYKADLDEDGHIVAEQLEAEYPSATVGNVIGEFSDIGAEFAYRPSAGTVDIESGYKVDHGGHLEAIKGNTIAWNQLIQNGDFSDDINGWIVFNMTYNITNNIVTITNTTSTQFNKGIVYSQKFGVTEHKYMCSFYAASSNSRTINVEFNNDVKLASFKTTSSLSLYKCIVTPTSFDPVNGFILKFDSFFGEQDETYSFSNIQVIDLTLIYGAGNEPTTAEQFDADYQKWFGKPLGYEEYDAGSLKPVKMTGIKTVGFNLWDEELEVGEISQTDGQNTTSSSIIRSKNYVKILPNTNYWFKKPSNLHVRIFKYGVNKDYLGGFVITAGNNSFRITDNTVYIRFQFSMIDYGSSTYQNDICINLSHSGDKDGEYEPYWSSTLNVPVTSLTGKLNGEGSSVVIFPGGMKKAGSVYDEILHDTNRVTKAVKNIRKKVFTASDVWSKQSTGIANKYQFVCKFSDMKSWPASQVGNIICSSYETISANDMYSTRQRGIAGYNGSSIRISDSTFDSMTEEQVASAMAGVEMYYALATPQEYLLDDFELPQDYDVDDYGTEEVLLGTNGCAPILDLKYGINAGDTIKNLPHSYVSAVGKQSFTEAQKERARKNIGAIEKEQLDALTRHTRKSDFDLNVLKQAVADQNLEKYGLKVGDETTINGHTYVIAGLNCMKGSHSHTATSNHVGLIVIPHTTQAWNASGNTYTGANERGAGYLNSDLHYYLKNTVLPLAKTDLGASNLISHNKLLSNAVDTTRYNRYGSASGCSSNWAWSTEYISALSEMQVYGGTVWSSSGYDTGEADQQLEVFKHYKHTDIFGDEYIWLRDVASAAYAAHADFHGFVDIHAVSDARYVAGLILFH